MTLVELKIIQEEIRNTEFYASQDKTYWDKEDPREKEFETKKKLHSEVERLRDFFSRIIDEECGPPKMSESPGTMVGRIRAIKNICRDALEGK